MSRLKEVALAIDQLANAILGGYASETISARCWRLRMIEPYRSLRTFIDKLFFWQQGHCEESYNALKMRLNTPSEYSNEVRYG